jgi:F-type H+-transporting ATPase subunit alpha
MEILKQPQYQPLPVEKQIILIYAATNRFLDDVDVKDLARFETDLYRFLDTQKADVLKLIVSKKALDDEVKKVLGDALKAFKEQFAPSKPAAPATAPEKKEPAAAKA